MSKSHDFSQLLTEFRNRDVNIKSDPAVIFLDTILQNGYVPVVPLC